MMGRRRYTTRLVCAAEGCNEVSWIESETRKDQAETLDWHAKHPYRCYRHNKPNEVLSAENPETTAVLVAMERYRDDRRDGRVFSGIYWGPEGSDPDRASSGLMSGPGFRAICKDFPPGTRLVVTARIELPDTTEEATNGR